MLRCGRIFDDIGSEINRVFGGLFVPNRFITDGSSGQKLQKTREPIVDLTQDDKNIRIVAELPGLNKDNVNLKVTENSIEITAENKNEDEIKEENWIRRERSYTKYYRKLKLPNKVIAEKASAKYKNGVLELTIPKAEDCTQHEVKIE